MKKILQKVFSLFKKNSPQTSAGGRKAKGQSMVEIAIALPILLFLFSGMIEFGFILNSYLSLLDATREAARFYSNLDPFGPDVNKSLARPAPAWFFEDSSNMVRTLLDPSLLDTPTTKYEGRKFPLDPALDDVIITIYSVKKTTETIVTTGPSHLHGHATSAFTPSEILAKMITGSPNAGILVVEVSYSYEQILGLPWTDFLGDHVMLRAHTIMPLNAAEPP